MVKFFETSFSYDYQWPAVTLAYFLRYPNPYSTHVVSSDTLSSTLDPTTGNLHVTRLHLKRGKLPQSVSRFIPKIKESYILEKTIVDARNRTLHTESRNLDWDGVLSVVESQTYEPAADGRDLTNVTTVVRFQSSIGRRGFFGGWGAGSVQRSIELVGRSRMKEGLAKSRKGIEIILEQMRERGFVGVVKAQRQGSWEKWRKAWREKEEVV